jgi:hypothetical protein
MGTIRIMMAGELEIKKKMEAPGLHEKVQNKTTILIRSK